MTEKETLGDLLTCQMEGCDRTFEMKFVAGLPDAARSLQAALEAHKAGWHAAGGPILCPECATKLVQHNSQ